MLSAFAAELDRTHDEVAEARRRVEAVNSFQWHAFGLVLGQAFAAPARTAMQAAQDMLRHTLEALAADAVALRATAEDYRRTEGTNAGSMGA
ncbi:hypothetical protein BJP25_23575 [Actinokineospora bangkokensis]|uniref:Uncharacterized protein n=1 Tax=Actinokineospora bangkokensis TaxID=1193682 RepID=A0A1Q9LIK5_9PSEU|nr:hypothetical protein BJP25_23575 [Actinokineospora bangkokensis]